MSKHLQGVMTKHFWRVGAATGIALVAVLVVCAPAQATVVKLSVPKMSRMATTVVVGRVASATPRHVSGHGWGSIVTDTTLRIDTVLKGTAPATLTLHLPGGRIGSVREVVEDVPTLAPGDSYILFLDGQGRIVGWSEGALPVVGGAVPALGGAPLRAAEGIIHRAAHPSLTGPLRTSAGEATLARPALASPLAPLPASVTADSTVALLSSGFEAGMSGWTLAGSPTWGRTTYRKQAGSYSAYCAQSTTAAPALTQTP